jgi:hypothetical protein
MHKTSRLCENSATYYVRPNFAAYDRAEQKKSRKSVLAGTVRSNASVFARRCKISAQYPDLNRSIGVTRVQMPHFQGHGQQTLDAAARARAVRSDLAAQQQKAVEVATEAYAKDKASCVG